MKKTDLKFITLEEGIRLLQKEAKDKPISIKKILEILSGRGRALIFIFLSLPFCQPIQIPGMSTPFGLVIAFVALKMAFGGHLWLPKSVLSKTVTPDTLQKIADKSLLVIRKVQPWIHPRLSWACHSPPMKIANSLIIFILGIVLALPLPIPLSNLTAAWSIFLIALGMLEDDGIFVLLGYSVALITIVFLVAVAFFLEHLF